MCSVLSLGFLMCHAAWSLIPFNRRFILRSSQPPPWSPGFRRPLLRTCIFIADSFLCGPFSCLGPLKKCPKLGLIFILSKINYIRFFCLVHAYTNWSPSSKLPIPYKLNIYKSTVSPDQIVYLPSISISVRYMTVIPLSLTKM